MSSVNSITVGWDEESLEIGFPSPIRWNFEKNAHMLVVGKTGSGKTYASLQILARIGKEMPDAHIYLLDYKADDFKFAQGCSRYYAYTSCADGLESFYKEFMDRQQGIDPTHTYRLLFLDEWASFLNCMDKKEAEESKKKLSTLLMLGRSFNCHVMISQQRADAKYFESARDNFSAILALGNLSEEGKQMLFAKEHREQMQPNRGRGTGCFYSDTGGLRSIIIPTVNNPERMREYIKQAVDRE